MYYNIHMLYYAHLYIYNILCECIIHKMYYTQLFALTNSENISLFLFSFHVIVLVIKEKSDLHATTNHEQNHKILSLRLMDSFPPSTEEKVESLDFCL